jgi:hypothetical protein
MYFNFLPSIKYDAKPISYPFSESDYVVAKNFFRRFKIADTAFSNTVFFNKYAVEDGQRLDLIAEAAYGSPFYDWVIALTNNMINPLFDLPMSEAELRRHIESRYDNPYYDIHHYEIISNEEQEELFGKIIIPGGTWVDEAFYNGEVDYVLDTLPNLSPVVDNLPYSTDYIFSIDDYFILESSGATVENYGSGIGTNSGFAIPYPPIKNNLYATGYLRFRGNSGIARYATFRPIETTYYNKVVIYAKFGTDGNGGEFPDLPNEFLRLDYRNDPSDPWTEIEMIIPVKMAQQILYSVVAVGPDGEGGPGRIPGTYNNVIIYETDLVTPTTMRANVIVNSSGGVDSITLVDRGYEIDLGSYIIRNQDIGNGYIISGGIQTSVSNITIQVSSLLQDDSGIQYGRKDSEPFRFTVNLPNAAKTSSTEFRLYQPSNTGVDNDNYGIQAIQFVGTIPVERPLNFEWNEIDANNYVIDNVIWTRINSAWYRKVQSGYQFWNGSSVEEVAGNVLARPVTEFEYETTENEKKREIYLLKPSYLETIVEDFRKAALYKKSSDFVSAQLKKTGV